jgi:beta-lactam-binding protein with PASTA domain
MNAHVAAVCVLALSLVAGCSQTEQPVMVVVPSVVGLPLPQAEARMTSAGLGSSSRMVGPCPACPFVNPNRPTPVVSGEKPSAGSKVPKATVIELDYPCSC